MHLHSPMVDPIPTVAPLQAAQDALSACLRDAGDTWDSSLRCAYLGGSVQARAEDLSALHWWQAAAWYGGLLCLVLLVAVVCLAVHRYRRLFV